MQSKSIVYKILSYPLFYNLFMRLISKKGGRQKYVDNYIKPFPALKIIDFGCGPGSIIEYLPEQVEYVGVDSEKNYIDSAKNKYGEKGKFIRQDILSISPKEVNYFDVAIANGLLHHLNDEESEKLIITANRVLKPGGRLVTIDNIFIKNQSLFARFLISKDRGQNVRTLDEYLKIGQNVFTKIEYQIMHDMLRIPYTHIIMTMTT